MKKHIFLFLIGIITAMFTVSAQAPADPVTWRAQVKMTSATEGTVIVRATVNKGWHLYGTDMPQGGPKPTSFNFAGSTGVKFIGTPTPSVKPVKKHDEMFSADVTYWEGRVTFTQRFTVTDPAKAKIAASVTYMGCNDETCSPPKTKKFTLNVPRPDGNTSATTRAN